METLYLEQRWPCQTLFEQTSRQPLKGVFTFASWVVFLLGLDDYGSLVIERSASVPPLHIFDQNFDHVWEGLGKLTRGRSLKAPARRL